MSINIITSFNSSSREELDKRSGPYASVAEALATLNTYSRAMGMPIYVITDGTQDAAGNYITGTVQTYYFTGGIEDANLIKRICNSTISLLDSGAKPDLKYIDLEFDSSTEVRCPLDAFTSEDIGKYLAIKNTHQNPNVVDGTEFPNSSLGRVVTVTTKIVSVAGGVATIDFSCNLTSNARAYSYTNNFDILQDVVNYAQENNVENIVRDGKGIYGINPIYSEKYTTQTAIVCENTFSLKIVGSDSNPFKFCVEDTIGVYDLFQLKKGNHDFTLDGKILPPDRHSLTTTKLWSVLNTTVNSQTAGDSVRTITIKNIVVTDILDNDGNDSWFCSIYSNSVGGANNTDKKQIVYFENIDVRCRFGGISSFSQSGNFNTLYHKNVNLERWSSNFIGELGRDAYDNSTLENMNDYGVQWTFENDFTVLNGVLTIDDLTSDFNFNDQQSAGLIGTSRTFKVEIDGVEYVSSSVNSPKSINVIGVADGSYTSTWKLIASKNYFGHPFYYHPNQDLYFDEVKQLHDLMWINSGGGVPNVNFNTIKIENSSIHGFSCINSGSDNYKTKLEALDSYIEFYQLSYLLEMSADGCDFQNGARVKYLTKFDNCNNRGDGSRVELTTRLITNNSNFGSYKGFRFLANDLRLVVKGVKNQSGAMSLPYGTGTNSKVYVSDVTIPKGVSTSLYAYYESPPIDLDYYFSNVRLYGQKSGGYNSLFAGTDFSSDNVRFHYNDCYISSGITSQRAPNPIFEPSSIHNGAMTFATENFQQEGSYTILSRIYTAEPYFVSERDARILRVCAFDTNKYIVTESNASFNRINLSLLNSLYDINDTIPSAYAFGQGSLFTGEFEVEFTNGSSTVFNQFLSEISSVDRLRLDGNISNVVFKSLTRVDGEIVKFRVDPKQARVIEIGSSVDRKYEDVIPTRYGVEGEVVYKTNSEVFWKNNITFTKQEDQLFTVTSASVQDLVNGTSSIIGNTSVTRFVVNTGVSNLSILQEKSDGTPYELFSFSLFESDGNEIVFNPSDSGSISFSQQYANSNYMLNYWIFRDTTDTYNCFVNNLTGDIVFSDQNSISLRAVDNFKIINGYTYSGSEWVRGNGGNIETLTTIEKEAILTECEDGYEVYDTDLNQKFIKIGSSWSEVVGDVGGSVSLLDFGAKPDLKYIDLEFDSSTEVRCPLDSFTSEDVGKYLAIKNTHHNPNTADGTEFPNSSLGRIITVTTKILSVTGGVATIDFSCSLTANARAYSYTNNFDLLQDAVNHVQTNKIETILRDGEGIYGINPLYSDKYPNQTAVICENTFKLKIVGDNTNPFKFCVEDSITEVDVIQLKQGNSDFTWDGKILPPDRFSLTFPLVWSVVNTNWNNQYAGNSVRTITIKNIVVTDILDTDGNDSWFVHIYQNTRGGLNNTNKKQIVYLENIDVRFRFGGFSSFSQNGNFNTLYHKNINTQRWSSNGVGELGRAAYDNSTLANMNDDNGQWTFENDFTVLGGVLTIDDLTSDFNFNDQQSAILISTSRTFVIEIAGVQYASSSVASPKSINVTGFADGSYTGTWKLISSKSYYGHPFYFHPNQDLYFDEVKQLHDLMWINSSGGVPNLTNNKIEFNSCDIAVSKFANTNHLPELKIIDSSVRELTNFAVKSAYFKGSYIGAGISTKEISSDGGNTFAGALSVIDVVYFESNEDTIIKALSFVDGSEVVLRNFKIGYPTWTNGANFVVPIVMSSGIIRFLNNKGDSAVPAKLNNSSDNLEIYFSDCDFTSYEKNTSIQVLENLKQNVNIHNSFFYVSGLTNSLPPLNHILLPIKQVSSTKDLLARVGINNLGNFVSSFNSNFVSNYMALNEGNRYNIDAPTTLIRAKTTGVNSDPNVISNEIRGVYFNKELSLYEGNIYFHINLEDSLDIFRIIERRGGGVNPKQFYHSNLRLKTLKREVGEIVLLQPQSDGTLKEISSSINKKYVNSFPTRKGVHLEKLYLNEDVSYVYKYVTNYLTDELSTITITDQSFTNETGSIVNISVFSKAGYYTIGQEFNELSKPYLSFTLITSLDEDVLFEPWLDGKGLGVWYYSAIYNGVEIQVSINHLTGLFIIENKNIASLPFTIKSSNNFKITGVEILSESWSRNYEGVGIETLTTSERVAILSECANGYEVYDTDLSQRYINLNGTWV